MKKVFALLTALACCFSLLVLPAAAEQDVMDGKFVPNTIPFNDSDHKAEINYNNQNIDLVEDFINEIMNYKLFLLPTIMYVFSNFILPSSLYSFFCFTKTRKDTTNILYTQKILIFYTFFLLLRHK